MKLTLETKESYSDIEQLFAAELARTHARSKITVANVGGKAVFTIAADDTTALRAAFNSVSSVLGMYEKTKEAIHGTK
jgi:tRNA threonylcarbamoyladenosine modification (KEOPS) complex  Pcc1 subunit